MTCNRLASIDARILDLRSEKCHGRCDLALMRDSRFEESVISAESAVRYSRGDENCIEVVFGVSGIA